MFQSTFNNALEYNSLIYFRLCETCLTDNDAFFQSNDLLFPVFKNYKYMKNQQDVNKKASFFERFFEPQNVFYSVRFFMCFYVRN